MESLESQWNLWNLIGIFGILSESLESLWNLWNLFRISGISAESLESLESSESYQNLWNLVRIFGIFGIFPESFQDSGIFGISCQKNRVIHPSYVTNLGEVLRDINLAACQDCISFVLASSHSISEIPCNAASPHPRCSPTPEKKTYVHA